ncbi:MAG: Fe-S protein assembly co-chaperone HscB [Chitinophagales bacterium]|nr:Fe-S protein assembly co-chaperone HscB [Chitinophagales bacterium]
MVNYFELYDIPVSFNPDQALVKSKYFELSRKYHPDRFTLAGAEQQAEALQMSSANNQAYKVLKDPYATMAYILKLKGVLEDEEKYNLPPDFLMEMMDLNETVSQYEMEPENVELLKESQEMLNSQLEEWELEVTPLTTLFNEGGETETLLNDIKDYYFRKKYLLRVKDRVDELS